MDSKLFISYLIPDRSYISLIKREIHSLVKPRFSEKRTGEIDIIVSELTSNLIKHANGGELLYKFHFEKEEPVLELICIDNGPGMRDVSNSMKDGVSTTNTLGQGIGSIMRLSSFSQIYSQEGWGTIVYLKIFEDPEKKSTPCKVVVRTIAVAKPGEHVSGDGYSLRFSDTKTYVLVGDGLGHGPHAKDATDAAIRIFGASKEEDPAGIVREVHEGVKKTRGLVGTVAMIDHSNKKLNICGVGNINTRVYKGLEYKNYVCNNGVIGMNVPTRIESSESDMEKYQQIIFCSDGIKTRWDLIKYPSILKYDPIILAAAIYKDQARRTDDMTIVIIKIL